MWRNALCLVAMALGLLSVTGAQPLSLKPLHVDANLRASIAVSAQFQSLIVDEARHLTLPVWAADFSPDEQVDFDQIVSRSFSELELPEEPGWGLFVPAGDTMQLRVRLTDRLGRLGRVEFRDAQGWRLVGSIWANVQRTEVLGSFSIPWDKRELVAEVLSDTGRVLARIAVDVGKFDTVAPMTMHGNFEPFRIDPVYCPHFGAQPGDAGGESGHPYSAPGSRCSIFPPGGWCSWTTICTDFTNDAPVPNSVAPIALHDLVRKKTIANTVNFSKFKIGDQQFVAQLAKAVQSAVQEDLSFALPRVTVPPYSEGCVKWQVYHYGTAKAVLALPFERWRRGAWLLDGALLRAIEQSALSGKKGFLSVLIASVANELLQDERNQQGTGGLKPGEVISWGDVYSVATKAEAWIPRLINLTQEIRILVKVRYSNGSEAPAEGTVDVVPVEANVQPAPPPGPGFRVSVPREGVTVQVGKGWKYRFKLTGGEEVIFSIPMPGNPPTVTLFVNLATPPPQPPAGE